MAEEVIPGSAPGAVAVADPPTEEVKQPIEQTPAAELPPVADQPAQEVEEEEPNLEEAPETSGDFSKYKPLFKDNPELRNIIGREAAFSQLGNFSEVKSIVERVPTVEDAEVLATQAENHRLLGETFRTDPVSFVESLKENDPNAFNNFARQLPQILAETDTETYTQQARYYVNQTMDNLWAMAQQSGDQEFLKAVQEVALKGLGYQLGSQNNRASTQPNSELEKLRRELRDIKNGQATQAVDQFWGELENTFIGNLLTEIETSIKKAAPTASEAAFKRMVKEAYDNANELLQSQPQTVAQVNKYRQLADQGKTSISDFKVALDYFTRRGKLVVPGTVKAVVEEWSKSVLKINADTINKKQAIAASTKDVGSAVQASSAAGGNPNGAKKLGTREAIFKAIETGTYSPRA